MTVVGQDGNANVKKNRNNGDDNQNNYRNHNCRKKWWWWSSLAAFIVVLYLFFVISEERTWDVQLDLVEKEAEEASSSTDAIKLAHKTDSLSTHADTSSNSPSGMPTSDDETTTLSNSPTPGQSPRVPTTVGQEAIESPSPMIASASPTAVPTTRDQVIEHDEKNKVDDLKPLYEVPFAVFDSLQYRRVCSPIGSSSVVCMTLRFPWADGVPLQDETVSYPKPVDERFYSLDKNEGVVFVDGDLLEQCKALTNDTVDETNENTDTLSPLDKLVKRCLDMVADKQRRLSVIVVFHREPRRNHEETEAAHDDTQKVVDDGTNDPSKFLFGTGRGKQLTNALNFFDGQVVQVFGDSTSPGATRCMQGLFGRTCVGSPVEKKVASFYCGGKKQTNNRRRRTTDSVDVGGTAGAIENDNGNNNEKQRYLRNQEDDIVGLVEDDDEFSPTNRSLAWTDMDEAYNIFLGQYGYFPPNKKKLVSHKLPQENLVDEMIEMGMKRNPGWTELRDLTIIIQYPFAHTQTQLMIYNEWDNVVEIQVKFPELILSVQTEEGRNTLKSLGWNLKHVIVYDGLPQFFPTESSAYPGPSVETEEEFLAQNGYPATGDSPGWRKEYGSSCRGPVPVTSKLTEVHMMSRTSFERLGFDMQYYIPNWEFHNQFWWDLNRWGLKGLDCTHGSTPYYCIGKYLLQALIDDYYDDKH